MNLTFDPNRFECVTTEKELAKWVSKVEAAKSYGYDTETTGLDQWTVDIVGHSLSYDDGTGHIEACYIPTGHQPERYKQAGVKRWLSNDVVLEALRPSLENAKQPKVLSNGMYDMLVLNQPRYNTAINNVEDTVWMAYTLHGNQVLAHGMDPMALLHLNYTTIKFHEVVVPALGILDFSYVPLPRATAYAAEDGAVTLMLAKVLQAKLKANNLWHVYRDFDKPMLPSIFEMMSTGIEIDAEQCRTLHKEWEAKKKEAEKQAWEIHGRKFSLSSPVQKATVLYEERKHEVRHWTDGKDPKPSTDKDAMEDMDDDPLVDVLLEYNQYATLVSNFAKPLPEQIKPQTGRIHTEIKATRTKTGRLASAGPNLQNIPTRSEAGHKLRGIFRAADGKVLVVADYSQIEYRILAHVCQDPYLLNAFRSGFDLHAAMAATVRGGDWRDYTNKKDAKRYALRTAFKNVNFAIIYGAGPAKIARMSKIDLGEALIILDHHAEIAPGIYDWKEGVVEAARDNLYTETMFGRRIHVPYILSAKGSLRGHAERLSVNGAIQGSAADLMRRALSRVKARLDASNYGAKLLLTVHDELVVECAPDVAEFVAEIMREEMEHAVDDYVEWSVPILAEVGKLGQTTWSAAK